MIQCFECGSPATQDHHVVPYCLGGRNKIPLCDSCHGKVHSPESTISTSKLARFTRSGRKPSKVDVVLFERIWLRRNDLSLEQAARKFGVSRQTVHRIYKECDSHLLRDVMKIREFYLQNHDKFIFKA